MGDRKKITMLLVGRNGEHLFRMGQAFVIVPLCMAIPLRFSIFISLGILILSEYLRSDFVHVETEGLRRQGESEAKR
jgi:hypothetical protein